MPNGGGYVNTYMDITNHKHVEEALRESEQNIRIYTDNVPVLIAYLDPESALPVYQQGLRGNLRTWIELHISGQACHKGTHDGRGI